MHELLLSGMTADRAHAKVTREMGLTPYEQGRLSSFYYKRSRSRVKNPRLQNMFVILATRGKTVLKYIGGNRFSSKGRAVLYPSRAAATYEARELKDKYAPALRGYTLRVQS